jgi:hypothetical protein
VYRYWRLLPVLVIGLVGLSCPGGAATPSAPPILTLDQVRPGMTGYGLTVIHGTKIDRFRVRIVGILRGGQSSDLILFRAAGPVIDEAGGAAAGMSGSPIYVDDRLIGALSYGYKFAGQDADLSLATPIEDMLKLLGAAPARETARSPRLYQAAQPFPGPAGLISRVLLMRSAADAAAYNARPLPHLLAVAPTAVPLFAAGMSPKAYALLSRTMARYNVVLMQGYGGRKEFTAPPLEPGSSLGVELARGDMEIGAIGTVTYRRGNQILGFGHPLLNAGPAALPLTAAWIDTVVRAIDAPFKEGSIGPLVGMVNQDRGTGLVGDVGRFPRLFAVRVRVHDGQHGAIRESDAQVVSRPDLAESLVPTVALSAVQRSLDRVSGGSARVHIDLRVRGLPGKIERQDLAYDVADIATASVLDVPSATQLLFGNFFKTLDPIDMTIDIDLGGQANTALLVDADTDGRTVAAGQALTVQIGLWPYNGTARVDRTVRFTVPRNFPPGPAFLLVGSAGGINDPTPLDQKFQTLVALQGTPVGAASSLTEAVDQFEDLGKNTEILVTLVPAPVMQALGLNANPAFVPAGTVLPTDWVVLGRFQIPMVVK